ncbi:DNA polymerase III, subunits gamma and tau [Edwardsiella piscicida]|uniref:DNA polymerase III subunit gamma/tau n=3 Tax=Edwardsiella TaxID=635 RepID=A0A0H3DRA2_EDWTF|nr:DNA polymerase III, subunits gamma and tau [Edwardsiella tarda EIB202]ADM41070.1 DNA polymerase III subunits gamma and tau [Edwardsiella tarda FL6-60]GAJ62807.1 DNA polymerase III subunits gamma and tau [Edwardsiella piscicida]GBK53805.1 DNA polymerase III subunits gamma and tau [Edwardsiella piscicida]GBK57507.1 DNA polymerase III subunits gamma and tau [Edwardsiella piscicida]
MIGAGGRQCSPRAISLTPLAVCGTVGESSYSISDESSMSYQVLARKWRPQTFADVVGQEHVLTALANGLSLGRIHHAYLFSGTRGVGKTSIARLLAKGLNCETGITATPCGVCDNCREIEQGRFVDLLEIDAASRTKVEDTRDLLDNVQYAPARGRFKVYLIDEVHMLSRHSFNALLKTLEEPPPHVKFLLATTDPQKLPVTILSRCLQFHLRALDHEQIRAQLEKIAHAEALTAEPRALQLLARAAEGSMRDALSLTDQAIAMGQGQITADAVSQMLGTLDDEQPLALIEALTAADGTLVMARVEQAAGRGVDWENLLVEMLALLHRVAMLQLLPSALDSQFAAVEPRLRELARMLPPADLQLFYQILLNGRKELAFAPDRRMGVEMTLLRALAFHPKAVIAEPSPAPSAAQGGDIPAVPATVAQRVAPPSPATVPPTVSAPPQAASAVPESTAQLLQARSRLRQKAAGGSEPKKSEPAAPQRAQPASSALERLASISERGQQKIASAEQEQASTRKEAYRWKAQNRPVEEKAPKTTPKALRSALEHEKTPELAAHLAQESLTRDAWAQELSQLRLPKLVQQLALNAFREPAPEGSVLLHLRSAQRHLNSASARQTLEQALSDHYGHPVALSIVEDDDPQRRTPLEWRQAIYEERLAQARASIAADGNIQTLRRLFDAELDEESIRPV